jgi:hypothetical protein
MKDKNAKMERLYPWLEKAKANQTSSTRILKELGKIKLIHSEEKKIRIENH